MILRRQERMRRGRNDGFLLAVLITTICLETLCNASSTTFVSQTKRREGGAINNQLKNDGAVIRRRRTYHVVNKEETGVDHGQEAGRFLFEDCLDCDHRTLDNLSFQSMSFSFSMSMSMSLDTSAPSVSSSPTPSTSVPPSSASMPPVVWPTSLPFPTSAPSISSSNNGSSSPTIIGTMGDPTFVPTLPTPSPTSISTNTDPTLVPTSASATSLSPTDGGAKGGGGATSAPAALSNPIIGGTPSPATTTTVNTLSTPQAPSTPNNFPSPASNGVVVLNNRRSCPEGSTSITLEEAIPVTIEYDYSVQTITDDTTFIPAVEGMILDAVAANVMQCTTQEADGSGAGLRQRSLYEKKRRKLEILELDSRPFDTAITTKCPSSENFCTAVEGRITIKHGGDSTGSDAVDECAQVIKDFLDVPENISEQIPYIVGVELLSVKTQDDHGNVGVFQDSENGGVSTLSLNTNKEQKETQALSSNNSAKAAAGFVLGGLAVTGLLVYTCPRYL